MLSGCGGDTIAFTYRGDEKAWMDAREAGKAAEAHKDLPVAETEFAKAVVYARRLETTNPHHLAETLSDLADVYRMEGKNTEAKATYQDVITVVRQMMKSHDSSELYRRVARVNETSSWLNIGEIYLAENNPTRAKEAFQQGLKVDAASSGMFPAVPKLKKAYADLLDKTGENPTLAKRLREEVTSATDGLLEGL
jgi:tetratricopeptide (TPR) repeat protein